MCKFPPQWGRGGGGGGDGFNIRANPTPHLKLIFDEVFAVWVEKALLFIL